MEHLELSLVVNNHILCGIREARLTTPFDIRRLWEHFSEAVENLLENGFYENERLEDAINNTNFKGWHSDSTYIHPGWDYHKYPATNLPYKYD